MTRAVPTDARKEEPVVLTVRQAAKLLQVSVNQVYALVAQNEIPSRRYGKLIRIPRWALIEHLAAGSDVPLPLTVALSSASSVHGDDANEEEA